ncbi:MAG: MYXO-CTERM sorting domain-containing protein [Nannocystaceae bacterium]
MSPRPRVSSGALGRLAAPTLAAALVAAALAPASALAGNGTHPRTPVLWDDPEDPNDGPACITIVDKTSQPLLHLNYWIPYEDVDKTIDEVDDSRRQQAFAFCRHHSPQDLLPVWINDVDVAAAKAKGLLVDDPVADEVLDTNADWQGCVVRLIADDQRREITWPEAAKGIDWDTTELAAGGYYIEGYTWEPPGNEWYRRAGVVKVADGPDPAASPPALALDIVDEFFFADMPLEVHGCVSAADGSTLDAWWSFPDPIEWKPFVTDEPVAGDQFSVDFVPPPETIKDFVMIKVTITDPMDRSSTAYANQIFTVLPEMGETSGGECGATFIANPGCETDTDGTASDGSSSTTGTSETSGTGSTDGSGSSGTATTTAGADDDGGGGGTCNCVSSGAPTPGALGLLVLVALGRRRRRPAARCAAK